MPPFDKFFQIPDLDPAVRKSFRREQLSELTLPLATSLMEGGFVSVVAAKAFNVEPWVIAVISAAPMFGNLSSFFWTRIASGRSKVPMMVTLQIAGVAVRGRHRAEPALARRQLDSADQRGDVRAS